MISAGLEGRLPYMTYPEPWRGPPKQPPEFLRPAPKPVPPVSRYNGVNTPPNGTRLAPSQQILSKYPSPPSVAAPINLTQHKNEIIEDLPYNYRLFTAAPPFSHFPPFSALYQNHYNQLMRSSFSNAQLSPLDTYSPPTPTAITSSTFLSPPSTFSPPSPIKGGRDPKRAQFVPSPQAAQHPAFKIPSGKEGSLKHRILTRPEDGHSPAPLDLQKHVETARKRLNATVSPPRSPKRTINNNNSVPGNFAKGSLIQLSTGELRRIEDMRTEDFVMSAEHSLELRLADSTVVKIEEHRSGGTATVTLSYNQRRTQVNVESALEHPFFVFGQGWASCCPERTQQYYQLKVHRLQVGDILISLTPRENPPASLPARSSTILTTATSTAMTARPLNSISSMHQQDQSHNKMQSIQNAHEALSPDSLAARKRRWSAPDQVSDEEEQRQARRQRIE